MPKRWQLVVGWSELVAGVGGLLMLPIVAYQGAIRLTLAYYLGSGVIFGATAVAARLSRLQLMRKSLGRHTR